jgi:hypothetical protein
LIWGSTSVRRAPRGLDSSLTSTRERWNLDLPHPALPAGVGSPGSLAKFCASGLPSRNRSIRDSPAGRIGMRLVCELRELPTVSRPPNDTSI